MANVLFIAIGLFILTAMLPASTRAETEPFEPSWFMVVDRANLLDENQERSAINDAWRLNTMGSPFQVVTETVALTQEGARQRADELRSLNGIESAPGADDGMLLYAAVNPANRESIQMAISVGANAVPRDGMTATSIQNVFDTIVMGQLNEGKPARALVYPIRELMYLRTFVPPPVVEPTGWQKSLQAPLGIVASMLAVAGVAATVFTLRRNESTWQRSALAAAALLAVAVLVIILAIPTQSTLAVLAAFILTACGIVLAIRTDRDAGKSPRALRRLHVSPRPPGSRSRAGAIR